MARGQVLTIQNQTSQLIETTSKDEAQSVAVLNPNDGVVYIKLNQRAGPTPPEWDWKLPSQSYGLFPGPWISLGLYYLDQSGSGRNAELNVYDMVDKLYMPQILAIGRAVQQSGSTVDISQGATPSNPPAGSIRLWADGSGNLHKLTSGGVDATVLDSTNYGTYALGGDLNGTILNGHVNLLSISGSTWTITGNLHATSFIYTGTLPAGLSAGDISADRGNGTGAYFFAGASNHYIYWNGSQFALSDATILPSPIYIGGTGQYFSWNGTYLLTSHSLVIQGSSPTVYFGDASHYLSLSGGILYLGPSTVPTNVQGQFSAARMASGPYMPPVDGDLAVRRAGGDAAIYFYDGSHNLYWTGSLFQLNGGNLVLSNALYPSGQTGAYIFAGGSNAILANAQIGAYSAYNGTNMNGFLLGNSSNYLGQGLAYSWLTWASIPHAKEFGLRISTIEDPLEPVRHITGYYYNHASMEMDNRTPKRKEDGSIEATMTYGFDPVEVAQYLPECVENNEQVDMMRMYVVLWEAVKSLDKRVLALTTP